MMLVTGFEKFQIVDNMYHNVYIIYLSILILCLAKKNWWQVLREL